MSSGGGQTQTQTTTYPDWYNEAGQKYNAMSDYVSKLGYMPNMGLDVAAFTPMQQQAMQNTANTASAFFGTPQMDAMAGMPTPTTNNLGFSGYSSGDLYQDAMSRLQQTSPAQYGAYQDMFINPQTGEQNVVFTPMGSFASPDASAGAQANATYNPSSTFEGTPQSAMSFDQSMQALIDAPSWLYALPIVGSAKGLAKMYQKQQNSLNDAATGGSDFDYRLSQNGMTTGYENWSSDSADNTVGTTGFTNNQMMNWG